jgi:(p)ppGpp synthase/HD superfamily hydrolase
MVSRPAAIWNTSRLAEQYANEPRLLRGKTDMLTDRFDDALAYASRIHRTQVRKGSGIPYVSHLLGVASLALEAGADEDQAIAALLHDSVEDQGGAARLADVRERFGARVADIVDHCTDADSEPKPPWRARKEAYIASLAHKPPQSLLVALADKTHNAGAILADLTTHGMVVWDRFTGGKDGTLWYYAALAESFCRYLPGAGADRFALIVSEMHVRHA